MNPVIKALTFRHACKSFDPRKKISKAHLDMILKAAHLSPSSFGMEAWKFIVISSDEMKKALRPACWNQPQITDAAYVIVICARPRVIDLLGNYAGKNFERSGLPEDVTKAYIEKYKNHMETEVFPRMSAYAWCSKQCYIALANIMTAAASEEIDSCPIEGFEKDRVEKILNIDTQKDEVVVLVALGYHMKEQPARRRHPMEQMIEYR